MNLEIDDRTIRARKFASQIMAIIQDCVSDKTGAESRLIHAAYDADVEITKVVAVTNKPHDRPAYGNPGGCECMKCGVIFVGAEHHEYCAICIEEIAKKIADEQNLDTTKPMISRT